MEMFKVFNGKDRFIDVQKEKYKNGSKGHFLDKGVFVIVRQGWWCLRVKS